MMRLEKRLEMGRKAPPTHSTCMMRALLSHFSVMRMTMNSCAVSMRPNMSGKQMKAVKRSNLRNTLRCRLRSSSTRVNTGCATPYTMLVMSEWPIVVHLLAWV